MSRKYYQEEYETMPRDKIRELQSKRLVEQFKYVYDNVEYYRNRCKEAGVTPDDIKSIDDLDKIPFTCKDDLRATYPYGLFAVPRKEVVRIHASSGTTGKQIVVGYTKGDLDIWDDCAARQLVAVGADEDDIVQDAYGYGLFTGGFGIHGGATKLGCQVIPISSGNTQRQITFMQDLKSTVLCCTPSYAAYLGETLKDMGLTPKDIHLKAGIFGAEPWTEEMRRDIEKSLGLKAYDIYGLTEVLGPGVAFECSEQAGMHVNEDHFIIETIDPKTGKRLPDGEKGELVFTALTKKAFPLMKGDWYQKVAWQCAEGHIFFASPYTVLKAGHWCPHCIREHQWDFDRLAKKNPFYAQVWYDSHDRTENTLYYVDENGESAMAA